MMQIFQLKSIEIRGHKNSNGGYKVWNGDLGLFESQEKAEDAMRQAISEMQWTKFLGFLICERELNSPFLQGEGNQAITTYLADGTLFCRSLCDDACEKPFKGRPAESIKFKPGELAWYWRGDRIEPCLVDLLPYSEEKYAEYCRKRGHSPDDPDFFPSTIPTTATWSMTTTTTTTIRVAMSYSPSTTPSPGGTGTAFWRQRNGGRTDVQDDLCRLDNEYSLYGVCGIKIKSVTPSQAMCSSVKSHLKMLE